MLSACPPPPPHAPALSVVSSDTRVQADVSVQSACDHRGISCSPGVSAAWAFPSLSLAGPAVMSHVAWTPQWGHGWGVSSATSSFLMMWGLLPEYAGWCGCEAFRYSPSLSPGVQENPPFGLEKTQGLGRAPKGVATESASFPRFCQVCGTGAWPP